MAFPLLGMGLGLLLPTLLGKKGGSTGAQGSSWGAEASVPFVSGNWKQMFPYYDQLQELLYKRATGGIDTDVMGNAYQQAGNMSRLFGEQMTGRGLGSSGIRAGGTRDIYSNALTNAIMQSMGIKENAASQLMGLQGQGQNLWMDWLNLNEIGIPQRQKQSKMAGMNALGQGLGMLASMYGMGAFGGAGMLAGGLGGGMGGGGGGGFFPLNNYFNPGKAPWG